MTRRPVRGLAPQEPSEPAPRPPGPTEILHPDGRRFYRHEDGLYYEEMGREVFSQSALRDLIERADERLKRDLNRGPDVLLTAILKARNVQELRNLWPLAPTRAQRAYILARRAVLELPPKEKP